MIHDLKPYPAYKDSGLPWIGEVPEHWVLQRLDRLFNLRNEAPLEGDQRVTGYLDGRVTLRSNVGGQKIKGVVKEAGWQRVHPGDFAISGMNAHLGGMGVSDSLGKCSPIYLVLQPKEGTNAHFVSHVVRLAAHCGALKALVNTIRFNSADFKRDDLKRIWVCLATQQEQASIVRFFGYVDQRIRRYIRAKKKLIALLNEQKQAIVHRAVTRGLDSNIRLKASGVDWLGDVPEHWEILRARYLFREVDLRSEDGTETPLSMSQKLGLVPSSMVEQRTLVSQSYVGGKLCKEDDLVLNRLKAHLGVFALARQSGVISPDYTVLRKIRPVAVQYFEHVLRSPGCRVELRVRAKGIVEGFWRLYTDDLYTIRLPVPPVNEQIEIVNAIDAATASIRVTSQQAEREIELLREYRTRLIVDVVTGKLDVREAAARLPDKDEELEPLDETEMLANGDEEGEGADDAFEEAEA